AQSDPRARGALGVGLDGELGPDRGGIRRHCPDRPQPGTRRARVRHGRSRPRRMIRLTRIGHVALRVADVERSRTFYTPLPGFEVVEEDYDEFPHARELFREGPGDRDAALVFPP